MTYMYIHLSFALLALGVLLWDSRWGRWLKASLALLLLYEIIQVYEHVPYGLHTEEDKQHLKKLYEWHDYFLEMKNGSRNQTKPE